MGIEDMLHQDTGFQNNTPLVETDWLKANLDAPDLRILDCTVFLTPDPAGGTFAESGRTQWEASHIPGSAFADVLDALSDPESKLRFTLPQADRVAMVMGELGVGVGTKVVLYCSRGHVFAARVWWILRVFGFDRVAILNGGLAKWKHEGGPLTATPTSISPAVFPVHERPGLFVGKAYMINALEADDVCIINSLTKEQHAGTGGSHYGRPGRIPGTSCVPASSLVDPDTLAYKPIKELHSAFAEIGALEAERVITYCGGGIAASSDAFVLHMLGVDKVSIYDGSLREWVGDSNLPMEIDQL